LKGGSKDWFSNLVAHANCTTTAKAVSNFKIRDITQILELPIHKILDDN
jgi:hypothetical protein